jgi:hypothetical protein
MLGTIGQVATDPEDVASLKHHRRIGESSPARWIIPEPVSEVVHHFKERLEVVDRIVGAAGASGVDLAHVL